MSVERLEQIAAKHNAETAKLADRAAKLLLSLREPLSIYHRRYRDPENLRTTEDYRTSELTYLQLVEYNARPKDSPGLPTGAEICTEPEAILSIMESHIYRITRGILQMNAPTKLAGRDVQPFSSVYSNTPYKDEDKYERMFGWFRPKVNGRIWYRGNQVNFGSDAVLILQPFKIEYRPEGAPFPELYVIGNPSSEDIIAVAEDYAEQSKSSQRHIK